MELTAASSSRSCGGCTAPVGLLGLHRMRILVAGERALSSASGCRRKPSSAFVGMITDLAPQRTPICSHQSLVVTEGGQHYSRGMPFAADLCIRDPVGRGHDDLVARPAESQHRLEKRLLRSVGADNLHPEAA